MDDNVVSVIIIFLNAQEFIAEAIASVFAQTYSNWELLLVDDGSTDSSTAIARACATGNSHRVRYLEHGGHANRGMSASRNLGIEHAKGAYIGFLDADDVWLPQKLEEQVAILRSQPEASLVFGPVQWWYSWTGNSTDATRDFTSLLPVPTDTLIQPPELLVQLLQRETVTITPGLVRRDAVAAVVGFEQSFRGLYEDQVFCAKVCTSFAVFVAHQCWYKWRKHADSACSEAVANDNYRTARGTFLSWLEDYLRRQQKLTPELSRVVKAEMRKCRRSFLQEAGTRAQSATVTVARRALPAPVRSWIRARLERGAYVPPTGWVRFGNFRRTAPFSASWGMDRGLPIDRHYIEQFLHQHSSDISGHVLEIGDDRYTRRFGGDRVVRSDVLHVAAHGGRVTITADLTSAESIPTGTFDCVICTQTLPFIYDVKAAIRTLHRILKPGGVLVGSVAGVIHPISRFDMERWGDFWRFTSLSIRLLLEESFPAAGVTVKGYGNVLAATAFVNGLAVEDLRADELDYCDPNFELTVGIRAVKPN